MLLVVMLALLAPVEASIINEMFGLGVPSHPHICIGVHRWEHLTSFRAEEDCDCDYTLEEIKAAGLSKSFARSARVAVDHRCRLFFAAQSSSRRLVRVVCLSVTYLREKSNGRDSSNGIDGSGQKINKS